MSDHEDWTADPYPLVLNLAKRTRERLRARHKGEDPQPVLAEGWPPPGWESGDCPVNDGNKAIGQWLDLVGKALEQLDGLAGKHGLAANDLGGPTARDAWRLLRHLHEQGRWAGDLPEAPGQPARPIDGLAMLARLRAALKGKPAPTGETDTDPSLLPTLLSAADLADRLRQPKSRVEVFLRRHHQNHPDCREEVPNPRKGEARYLYRVRDVWPALQARLPRWASLMDD